MREVGLRGFTVGHCVHPQVSTIRGGSWRPVRFPALAMLIDHPGEGAILFDTGYDRAFWRATDRFPERLYRWATPPSLDPAEELGNQLRAAGIAARDIRHIVVSHFHADHVAGLGHFPAATVHCAKAGLAAACSGGRLAATRRGMLPTLLPTDLASRARWFEDRPRATLPAALAPFDTAADLLGDASLLAIELPGHCPGHWGLLMRERGCGLHFLVGDAAWSSAAIQEDRPPPAITAALLGDARRARATLHRLHELHHANPDITLTPSHCPERAAAFRAR